MPEYDNWNDETHLTIEMSRFVTLKNLVNALNAARHIAYSVKASRDEARNRFLDLPIVSVSKAARFPVGVLVNISFGIVAESLDRILAALDHGEREMDRDASTSKYGHLSDSKVAFMKGIQSLMQTIMRPPAVLMGEGVYSQTTFETYYGLHWAAN